MKYLSLFSGIGGFELGIDKAWQHQGQGRPRSLQRVLRQGDMAHLSGQSPNRPICIGYSEIDKYAIKVYERQFNGHTNYGDCTTINAGELPDFDLLVGGFPCQAFSVAGKRAGFNDTRGTLFFDIARILKEKRPRHLVLENVKGLLSHDSGRTFTTILGVLTDLGYLVEWQVLNSKDFGVPQNRERIYIIGHLRGECSGEVFPIAGTDQEDTRIIGQDVAYTIDANYHKGTNTLEKSRRSLVAESWKDGYEKGFKAGKNTVKNQKKPLKALSDSCLHSTLVECLFSDANNCLQTNYSTNSKDINQLNQPKHSNDRVYGTDGISPTLNTMQGGNRQPFIAPVLTPDRPVKRQNGRRFKENGEPSFTVTAQDRHGLYDGARIRRLTPKECERLQGFPDEFTKYDQEGNEISDTQRYKMCGNAVTVNVVEAVITNLMGCLTAPTKDLPLDIKGENK